MGIKPIKRVNIGEQVFQQMKDLLISGEWKPGDKLPSETELAEKFGISRITVRQALQKLSALNLIETRLGEGSFVKKVEIDQPLNALISTAYLGDQTNFQVFEFRTIIEVESAALAAKRAEASDIEKLNEIQQRMEIAADDPETTKEQFADMDLEFHYLVGCITKNPLVIRTNAILRDVLKHSMNDVIYRMGFEPALKYHKEIIQAIADHDQDRARRLMREHIEKNEAYFDLTDEK